MLFEVIDLFAAILTLSFIAKLVFIGNSDRTEIYGLEKRSLMNQHVVRRG